MGRPPAYRSLPPRTGADRSSWLAPSCSGCGRTIMRTGSTVKQKSEGPPRLPRAGPRPAVGRTLTGPMPDHVTAGHLMVAGVQSPPASGSPSLVPGPKEDCVNGPGPVRSGRLTDGANLDRTLG